MNVGIIPETILERLGLRLGLAPVPILDVLCAPLKARVVMAGVRLGIFESLRERPRTASDLSEALGFDRGGLDILLRALVQARYLELRLGSYWLSALARRTMVPGAPMQLTAYVRWNEIQWRFLDELDSMVRTGRGVDFHRTLQGPEAWSDYQRAMLEVARLDSPTLTRLVPVAAGAERLLDLGGAHGFLGAAICRSRPPLRSTVIDLPCAIEHGRRIAREGGYSDVVEFCGGDLLTHSFEESDVALLSNVLHHLSPPQIEPLLARVQAALRPGGTIAIWEMEAPRGVRAHGHAVLAGLFFRLTSTADVYHGSEYAGWLAAAGFRGIRSLRPRWTPGRVLVLGRK
jgi:hypothetical protein